MYVRPEFDVELLNVPPEFSCDTNFMASGN